jgi:hypothetical protein
MSGFNYPFGGFDLLARAAFFLCPRYCRERLESAEEKVGRLDYFCIQMDQASSFEQLEKCT